jgi:hypothetical protein
MKSIQSKLAKVLLWILKTNKIWKLTGDELKNSIEKRQFSFLNQRKQGNKLFKL